MNFVPGPVELYFPLELGLVLVILFKSLLPESGNLLLLLYCVH